jgi:hypothetical protein
VVGVLIQGDVQGELQGSGELLELHWVSIDDARTLELPQITRLVLDEVERRLREGHTPAEHGPFVHFKHGKAVLETN